MRISNYSAFFVLCLLPCVAGCPREQKVTRPIETSLHEDQIAARYTALGKLAKGRLLAARVALDEVCKNHDATHHTNLTLVTCGYDLEEGKWKGDILIEATCTIGSEQATYAREVHFEIVGESQATGSWSVGEPGNNNTGKMSSNLPADTLAAFEGFGELLSAQVLMP